MFCFVGSFLARITKDQSHDRIYCLLQLEVKSRYFYNVASKYSFVSKTSISLVNSSSLKDTLGRLPPVDVVVSHVLI